MGFVFRCKMSKQEINRKKIITKFLENNNKSIRLIAKETKCAISTVSTVIKRYKETLTTARKSGSGRKSGFGDQKAVQKVTARAKKKPNSTLRELAKKTGISKSTVQRVLVKTGLKSYSVQKTANRNDQQAARAKLRARKLYDQLLRGQNHCIVMDDETYVFADFKQLPGRSFYRAFQRFGVESKFKYRKMTKFPKKFMVWQAICSYGRKSKTYIAKGNMRSDTYIKECLNSRLLPFLKSHNGPTLFWPDLAAIHYSANVLQWYESNGVQIVPKELNPPNSPHIRPVEKYWALVKQQLRKHQKIATNALSFQKYWIAAAKKIDETVVRRLMEGLPAKVNKFSRTSIED